MQPRSTSRVSRCATPGRKLLVPYVTGGLGSQWLDVVRAVIDSGADAVEIGIPFSDPIMDGRTIQEASQRALDLGATPLGVDRAAGELDAPVPLVVMTYYNLVARDGPRALRGGAERESGVDGRDPARPAARRARRLGRRRDAHGVEVVLLAAPTTTDERLARDLRVLAGLRLRRLAARRHRRTGGAGRARRADGPPSEGRHGSSRSCSASASRRRPRRRRRRPASDGVIVGSALVRRLLDGGGPDEARSFVASLRAALDGGLSRRT